LHSFIAGAWVLLVGGWLLWVRAWLWRIELTALLSPVLPKDFSWLPEGLGPEVRAEAQGHSLRWRAGFLGVRTFYKEGSSPWKELRIPLENQLSPGVLLLALQQPAGS
jgi:hypothetical protein